MDAKIRRLDFLGTVALSQDARRTKTFDGSKMRAAV
jgi:hypothetical protein